MNNLAGIDTTKVYHEFEFSSAQVKNLQREQWFIHVDLVNWLEEELNRKADWNAIKILYTEVYHFDFNHVKCLEIYYNFNFDNPIMKFLENAQYKMQWKSETIYYIQNFPGKFQKVDDQLGNNNVAKYLIKSYDMKVDWNTECSLTVYEFKHDLNNEQKLILDKIFGDFTAGEDLLFITGKFLFLNEAEPPTIMETEVLLPFHGNFLADLNIEDILALELANKDHRLSFYDRDLDHDIQMQLQTRFPKFYKNKKLKTYDAKDFTNIRIFKYFIYKYRHCLREVFMVQQPENYYDLLVIQYENKNLKFRISTVDHDHRLRVNIILPGNITVCSLTLSMFNIQGEESVRPCTRYIHLDYDDNLNDLKISEFQIRHMSFCYNCTAIEILIRTNDPPVTLFVLIRKILEATGIYGPTINTTSLASFKNHINHCTLNGVEPSIKRGIAFKNVTVHFKSLLILLNKIKDNTTVSFDNCQILLSRSRNKIRKITRIQNENMVLTFRNMNIDELLPIECPTIVYDKCNIIPSVWLALSSTTFYSLDFANMRIELDVIASLKCFEINLLKCQIEPKQAILLKSNSTIESWSAGSAGFFNTDLDVGTLIKFADFKSSVYIYNSRILCLSNDIVDSHPNCPLDKNRISFNHMMIEIKTLYTILYKFDDVTFHRCRILFTNDFQPKIPIKLEDLIFNDVPITTEFINNLKYFEVVKPITIWSYEMTNENLIEIWRTKPDQKFIINGGHRISVHFYLELLATIYENRVDELLQFKDGILYPFGILIEIDWQRTLFCHIDWSKTQIRSVLVNDVTIKLEYIQNGKVFDLFDELNKLPNDTDICEVNYF